MSTLVTLTVRAVSAKHPETTGVVHIKAWNKRGRILRALKILCGLWVAALVAIFIPVIHFILAPLLFLAGPGAALYAYTQKSIITGGEIMCPNCLHEFQVIRGPEHWPLHAVCSACRAFVRVEQE